MKRDILLVDDHSCTRKYLGDLLDKLEISFQIAKSGEEGLEIFQSNKDKFRAIITDIVMYSELDGIEMIQAINNLGYAPPVIFISSFEEELRRAAKIPNCRGLFRKPFGFEVFKRALFSLKAA